MTTDIILNKYWMKVYQTGFDDVESLLQFFSFSSLFLETLIVDAVSSYFNGLCRKSNMDLGLDLGKQRICFVCVCYVSLFTVICDQITYFEKCYESCLILDQNERLIEFSWIMFQSNSATISVHLCDC